MAVAESRHLNGQVNFYRLSRKFVDESEMPQEAKQVMYYSLAIGHHLGIVDCLKSEMDCTGQEYLEWISALPEDSDAYRKMKGFLMFGKLPCILNTLICWHWLLIRLRVQNSQKNPGTDPGASEHSDSHPS